jgi:hypothetical protein
MCDHLHTGDEWNSITYVPRAIAPSGKLTLSIELFGGGVGRGKSR